MAEKQSRSRANRWMRCRQNTGKAKGNRTVGQEDLTKGNILRKPLIVRVGQGPLFISETKLIGKVANLNIWDRFSISPKKRQSVWIQGALLWGGVRLQQLQSDQKHSSRWLLYDAQLHCGYFDLHSGNMVSFRTSWSITGRLAWKTKKILKFFSSLIKKLYLDDSEISCQKSLHLYVPVR